MQNICWHTQKRRLSATNSYNAYASLCITRVHRAWMAQPLRCFRHSWWLNSPTWRCSLRVDRWISMTPCIFQSPQNTAWTTLKAFWTQMLCWFLLWVDDSGQRFETCILDRLSRVSSSFRESMNMKNSREIAKRGSDGGKQQELESRAMCLCSISS